MVPTEQQPSPSSQKDHLSPSETEPTGSGSLHWPTSPNKKWPQSRSCRAQVLFLLLLLLHFASSSAMSYPPPLLPPPAAVPPRAALSTKFSGWSWVAMNYGKAFGAAAVGAHGLGDRKELSASHKQDPSCTHYSQDLLRNFPGKSFRRPLFTGTS